MNLNVGNRSVLRDLSAARAALEESGITGRDADTCMETVVARMPGKPFAPGGLAMYFADLDREMRPLPIAERNGHLMDLFGADAVRGAVILCARFALTPQGVDA